MSDARASLRWIAEASFQAPTTTRRYRPGRRSCGGSGGSASGTASNCRGCGATAGTRREFGQATAPCRST
eukprot:11194820-Lingulodinium_polyedra.AAC.1